VHRRRMFPAQLAPRPLLQCAAFAVDAGLSSDAWLHWSTPKRRMTALTVSGTAACARLLTFIRGQGSFLQRPIEQPSPAAAGKRGTSTWQPNILIRRRTMAHPPRHGARWQSLRS
jgi:hypothetical protein